MQVKGHGNLFFFLLESLNYFPTVLMFIIDNIVGTFSRDLGDQPEHNCLHEKNKEATGRHRTPTGIWVWKSSGYGRQNSWFIYLMKTYLLSNKHAMFIYRNILSDGSTDYIHSTSFIKSLGKSSAIA